MKSDKEVNLNERDREFQKKPKTSWKVWLVFFVVLCLLVVLAVPPFRGRGNHHDRTRAISHATQVKLALFMFEDEYGILPSQLVVDRAIVPGAKAKTANDCFRQLIQGSETLRSEVIFYAPTKFTFDPDGEIGDPSNHFAQACAKGEVGFLYIDSPSPFSLTPMIAAPLSDAEGRFDSEIYNGKAVVLFRDGSVQLLDIDSDSKKLIIKSDGKDVELFSLQNPNFPAGSQVKYPVPK